MGDVYKEIASSLIEVSEIQEKRWEGLEGNDFRKESARVIEMIIEIEGMLESHGYKTGVVQKEGTVFQKAYRGELGGGCVQKEDGCQLVDRVKKMVEIDIVNDIRLVG